MPNIGKLDTYYGYLQCNKYIICRPESLKKIQINTAITHVPAFI